MIQDGVRRVWTPAEKSDTGGLWSIESRRGPWEEMVALSCARSSVDAIIAAAGLSKRMGRSKMLISIAGVPVIRRVTAAVVSSRIRWSAVVLGRDSENVSAVLSGMTEDRRVDTIVNPAPENGMASSIRVGVESLDGTATGVAVILGDQPGITSDAIDRLIGAFEPNPQQIVCSAVNGRRTTPVIFPAELIPELSEQHGDIGGREVIRRYPERVLYVELGDVYDDTDLDTPEDLERIRNLSPFSGEPRKT
jgi:molybdenum cofactor cytidylyltransferase